MLYRLSFPKPVVGLILAALLASPCTFAQSTEPSDVSAISLEPSGEAIAIVPDALSAGTELVVTSLRPVGDIVVLSAETSGHVVVGGLKISGATAHASGVVVGTTLSVTAITAGLLIYAGSEAIAFIPNQLGRSLTHSRQL